MGILKLSTIADWHSGIVYGILQMTISKGKLPERAGHPARDPVSHIAAGQSREPKLNNKHGCLAAVNLY